SVNDCCILRQLRRRKRQIQRMVFEGISKMNLLLSVIYLTYLPSSIFGGNGLTSCLNSECLDDPSAVKCIHNGELIHKLECRKRCKQFYQNIGHVGKIIASCENKEECACQHNWLEIETLSNLEEDHFRKMKEKEWSNEVGTDVAGSSQSNAGPSNTNKSDDSDDSDGCFYRGSLISDKQCWKKCTELSRIGSFGLVQNRCDEYYSCMCGIWNSHGLLFERADTLEAEYLKVSKSADVEFDEDIKYILRMSLEHPLDGSCLSWMTQIFSKT
ncbi:hypothetical protein QAD02_001017, partial [Eretmocerus hayati]